MKVTSCVLHYNNLRGRYALTTGVKAVELARQRVQAGTRSKSRGRIV